jgi:hypothetical protein
MSKIKKYKVTQEDIAKWFGYSNVDSFRNSTKKDSIMQGVEKVIRRIESEMMDYLDNE